MLPAITIRSLHNFGFGLSPRTRHARISPLIRGMILALGVNVFRPVLVVLQRRDGADRILARIEAVEHRPVVFPDHPRSYLVPAAHPPDTRYSFVVGRLPIQAHSLDYRRPAVLREARGVDHPVFDRLSRFPQPDALADFLGSHLQADVRLLRAVPF